MFTTIINNLKNKVSQFEAAIKEKELEYNSKLDILDKALIEFVKDSPVKILLNESPTLGIVKFAVENPEDLFYPYYITMCFDSPIISDKKPKSYKLVPSSWFSTSKIPTKSNGLLDYLKAVVFLNEKIINDVEATQKLIDIYVHFNKTSEELYDLQCERAKIENYIETLKKIYSYFNTIDYKKVKSASNKLSSNELYAAFKDTSISAGTKKVFFERLIKFYNNLELL